MSGPVTYAALSDLGEMRPIWGYAAAIHSTTKDFARELESLGIPLISFARFQMAPARRVEQLIRELTQKAEADLIAKAARQRRSNAYTREAPLEEHIERQTHALSELKVHIEELQRQQQGAS